MEWVIDLVLFGGCLLVLYFNRGRRAAWALPAAIACVAVGALVFLVEVTSKRVKTPDEPLPSAAQVRASFESSAVTANADVLYHGNGFSITIPKGYRYAKLQDPLMFMASRGDRGIGITVLRHDLGNDDPEPTVKQSLELMKKGNASYEFSPLTVDPSQQMRTRFRVTKNGVPLRGLLVFAERDDKLWQLTVTGPANVDDVTLDHIAQSWTVD
jgi:hypothetical protein